MPDLTMLDAYGLRRSFAARSIARAFPFKDQPAVGFLFNLARLTVKAIQDYEHAREHLGNHAGDSGRIIEYFGWIDDLESCINSTYRAFRFAEALRRARPGADGEPPLNEHVRRLVQAHGPEFQQLRRIRHNIEHREEHLGVKSRPDGEAAYLAPQSTNVYVGDQHISYIDLARLVRALFDITTAIVPIDLTA